MTKTNNRIAVTIVTETAKARLVQDTAGRKGWIQNRSLRADGTVAADTFEKAAASFSEREQIKADNRTWDNEYHAFTMARESEKAVAISGVARDGSYTQEIDFLIWVPKSVLRDGKVPGWIIWKKLAEAGERILGNKNHFSVELEIVIGDRTCFHHAIPSGW